MLFQGRDNRIGIKEALAGTENVPDKAKATLLRHYHIEATVNLVLRAALEDRPLDDLLQYALDMSLALPLLGDEPRGCVFLVETDPDVLVMRAHSGLPAELATLCARVRFGSCLCGRAALTQKAEFAEGAHEGHPRVHAHVGDHGHYCVPIVFHDRTLGVINMYTGAGHKRNVVEEEFLTTIAETLATLIERRRAEKALRKSIEGLERALEGAVHSLASTAGRRDPYTQSHQERVAALACAIAEEMGLDGDRIDGLRVAATLHDVGKITVPSEILAKPGALTDIEFGIIKGHAQAGSDVVEGIPFPWPVALIILQHHERLNGTGYPNGLRAEELLLEARILAVADVVEAMASHRPYRPALGVDRALEEIAMDAGALYDAEAVDACVRLLSSGAFDLG